MSSCKLYCENFKIYNDCCKNSEQQSESGENQQGFSQNLNSQIKLITSPFTLAWYPPVEGESANISVQQQLPILDVYSVTPNLNLANINGWNGLFGRNAAVQTIDIIMPKAGPVDSANFTFNSLFNRANIEKFSLLVESTSNPLIDFDSYPNIANYIYTKSAITISDNTSPLHLFFSIPNLVICVIGSDSDFKQIFDIALTPPVIGDPINVSENPPSQSIANVIYQFDAVIF